MFPPADVTGPELDNSVVVVVVVVGDVVEVGRGFMFVSPIAETFLPPILYVKLHLRRCMYIKINVVCNDNFILPPFSNMFFLDIFNHNTTDFFTVVLFYLNQFSLKAGMISMIIF